MQTPLPRLLRCFQVRILHFFVRILTTSFFLLVIIICSATSVCHRYLDDA